LEMGFMMIWRGLISLWLYKEDTSYEIEKNVYALHVPPWAPHTYVFVVLTSLTHPRKILSVMLQIGDRKSQRLISIPTYSWLRFSFMHSSASHQIIPVGIHTCCGLNIEYKSVSKNLWSHAVIIYIDENTLL
jgi:hypothetical protein